MSQQMIEILGTQIHNLSQKEVIGVVEKAIKEDTQIHLEGVNAGKMVDMRHDDELRDSVNNSNLVTADGQSVVWASKVLNKPIKERVAGIDLMIKLVELSAEKGYKLFLFGAKEEVVKTVVDLYSETYSPALIAGYRNGYFQPEDEVQIAQQIADSGANILFVAITSPIKEHFLHRHKEILSGIHLIMGVGGSFDVVAGVTKRAPIWMQKIGMEWFYRFAQEPKRMWKRYLVGNSSFMWLVLKEKFKRSKK